MILTSTMLPFPLTVTIYLPLLPLPATHFQVSIQAINFTITLYIGLQAVSPLLFTMASDSFGRRPILLLTYAVYTVASLGTGIEQKQLGRLTSPARGAKSWGISSFGHRVRRDCRCLSAG